MISRYLRYLPSLPYFTCTCNISVCLATLNKYETGEMQATKQTFPGPQKFTLHFQKAIDFLPQEPQLTFSFSPPTLSDSSLQRILKQPTCQAASLLPHQSQSRPSLPPLSLKYGTWSSFKTSTIFGQSLTRASMSRVSLLRLTLSNGPSRMARSRR